ncbi:neurturin-like [Anguilla rostrata]|uniref:neurturin-like n=1 Tax=Anguilla anguilla TaxID=7936 RepID=UPI0015AF4CCA|nr:neurturin-like [Anguilla anguilla]
MKLWKCAALAVMLCGAALSLFLTRIMVPSRARRLHPASFATQPPSSPSSSDSASSLTDRHHRTARAAEGMNSLLSELSHVFQSFTEGELKQIIAAFVDKKARRDILDASQIKRTKRARKRQNSCSLKHKVVTVSQLGLGHDSNEELRFQYCSGRCMGQRKNYDVALNTMRKNGVIENAKARHKPCCRPTVYDDISFFDDMNFKYYTLRNLTARECGCV